MSAVCPSACTKARSGNTRFRRYSMLSEELLKVLVCPKCKGELEYDRENEKLLCYVCKLSYEVKDNIPIMLIEEAEKF
jgi:uncharacterized protein YbaR (Trm112 family)